MAPFHYQDELQWDRRIIEQLGDFTAIHSPAKCAARIGQAFSETPDVVPLEGISVSVGSDVERYGRVFSDGVGTFSTSVMHQIWDALPAKHIIKPTLFQIRQAGICDHYPCIFFVDNYLGAKGMISLDNRLQGNQLIL